MSGKGTLTNLQVMRGVAALMVCVYHLRYLLESESAEWIFRNGWIGVQVFFVISGFIMVYTTERSADRPGASPRIFLIKRLVRIVPLYFIATFLYLIMLEPAFDLSAERTSQLIRSLLFIPQMTSEEGPAYGFPVIHVGWSLNYEMLFYLVFFAGLFITSKLRKVVLTSILLIAGVLIPSWFAGALHTSYAEYLNYPLPVLNFLLNPVLTLFLAGVLLGHLYQVVTIPKRSGRMLLVFSIIAFLSYVLGITGIPFNSFTDSVFCGLIVFALVMNDKHSDDLTAKKNWWTFLGDSSYSIYLLHPILIIVVKRVFHKLQVESNILIFITGMMLILIVSGLSFRFIESGISGKLKKILNV